jgi:hypothetical protein
MSPVSEPALSRRAVLLGLGSLALGLSLPTRYAAATPPAARTFDYRVEMSMLFDLLRYSVAGSMVEEVDARAGPIASSSAGAAPAFPRVSKRKA